MSSEGWSSRLQEGSPGRLEASFLIMGTCTYGCQTLLTTYPLASGGSNPRGETNCLCPSLRSHLLSLCHSRSLGVDHLVRSTWEGTGTWLPLGKRGLSNNLYSCLKTTAISAGHWARELGKNWWKR